MLLPLIQRSSAGESGSQSHHFPAVRPGIGNSCPAVVPRRSASSNNGSRATRANLRAGPQPTLQIGQHSLALSSLQKPAKSAVILLPLVLGQIQGRRPGSDDVRHDTGRVSRPLESGPVSPGRSPNPAAPRSKPRRQPRSSPTWPSRHPTCAGETPPIRSTHPALATCRQ